MSVVGFDIGTFKSSIGIAKQGGVEIIDNDYSDRITPTYVSFTNRQRFQGHAAKQQEITNFKNTISSFKPLLGRKFHDPQVQVEQQFTELRISSGNDDRILFNVDYMNDVKEFTCEQIMAIFLTKLKAIAESHLLVKVTDCVISCPSFMTDTERRALLDAAQIVGLNCLKLMNDTSAVALNYGYYKTDLPEPLKKSHLVAFVDVGFSQTQVSICAFNQGNLKIIASDFDSNLGGRDFDKIIMDYFQQDFKAKYNLDAYSNPRAKLRLKAECEKIKKMMSSNTGVIPLNIECFLNDKDVSSKIKREDFEKLAESLLVRFKNLLQNLLAEAKLKPEEIDLIEIVGGSTRVPAIKTKIFEVFGKEPSTTLNSDEAIARGCTLQCAILSPTFKVKDFKIEDCQLFRIVLNWKENENQENELSVLDRWDMIPNSKFLILYKNRSLNYEAHYKFSPFNNTLISRFNISNVIPGKNTGVKIKAEITKNGTLEILTPQLVDVCKIKFEGCQLSKEEINILVVNELTMAIQDRKEKDRLEAKNSVEEYIYEIRDKLSNEFERFVLPEEKEIITNILNETESWLYNDETDDQERSVYIEKLNKMKEYGEPIRKRFKDDEAGIPFLGRIGKSVQQISKGFLNYFK